MMVVDRLSAGFEAASDGESERARHCLSPGSACWKEILQSNATGGAIDSQAGAQDLGGDRFEIRGNAFRPGVFNTPNASHRDGLATFTAGYASRQHLVAFPGARLEVESGVNLE